MKNFGILQKEKKEEEEKEKEKVENESFFNRIEILILSLLLYSKIIFLIFYLLFDIKNKIYLFYKKLNKEFYFLKF